MGRSWILQKVKYELRADVYILKVDESREYPKVIDRLWIKRSIVHGCHLG
jgi:hypothetical protein